MENVSSGLPPAGWYENPLAPETERFWDGANWTNDTRAKASAAGFAPIGNPVPSPYTPSAPLTPAGWYPDPSDPTSSRRWTGETWSDEKRPLPPQTYQSTPTPPPPYGYTAMGAAQMYAPVATNGLAVASLVLGILWVCYIGSVLAVIFGHVALNQIKSSGGRQGGTGLAKAGLTLGWIGVGIFVLSVVIGIADGASQTGR